MVAGRRRLKTAAAWRGGSVAEMGGKRREDETSDIEGGAGGGGRMKAIYALLSLPSAAAPHTAALGDEQIIMAAVAQSQTSWRIRRSYGIWLRGALAGGGGVTHRLASCRNAPTCLLWRQHALYRRIKHPSLCMLARTHCCAQHVSAPVPSA